MKIGVDASCWSNKRGFGRFCREILKSLLSMDSENDYWFFLDKATASDCYFPENAQLVEIETNVSPTTAASASGRRSFRDLWAMTRGVWAYDLDLFFFPAVYSYFPILNRTKIIGTIHDMTPKSCPNEIFPDKKLRFFWNLKERIAVWQSHLIITVSEFSKQEIIRYYRLPESKVAAVSEGPNHAFKPLLPDERLDELLGRFQIDPEEDYLLYVGGISPHKNLGALIRAFKDILSDACFSNLKLMLVGDYKSDSFHSDYLNMSELVHRSGLEKKVIFTGFVEDKDLAYLYNAASILVFPSFAEGFGLPAVEAMACGTPVAASHAGSLPEILGDAGIYFDPHNRDEMSTVIRRILSNDALRDDMRRKGLDRARLFTWESAAENLLNTFQNLVRS